MVNNINYNGGKEVSYQYDATGALIEMNDWTGRTAFEVDLLNRITKTTDTKGKAVEYTYDEILQLTILIVIQIVQTNAIIQIIDKPAFLAGLSII